MRGCHTVVMRVFAAWVKGYTASIPFSFSIDQSALGLVWGARILGFPLAAQLKRGASTDPIWILKPFCKLKDSVSAVCDVETHLFGRSRRVLSSQWCAWVHGWRFRKQDRRPWANSRGVLCPLVSLVTCFLRSIREICISEKRES